MSIIFSLIPFIFIIYYTIMVKNTKYVTMDLRNGEMCYCCKDKIDIDKNALLNNILNNKNEIEKSKPATLFFLSKLLMKMMHGIR